MSDSAAQRRAAFRVKIPDPGWLTATIVNPEGERIGALVMDLSRMGMGAQLPAGVVIQQGAQLHCKLEFEEMTVDTQATVRHCAPDPRSTRLGLEFTDVTPLLDSILNRAVFRLQRYLLRRQQGRAGRLGR
jgi:c-di-GMP-binding flagellar brake protein YcgR